MRIYSICICLAFLHTAKAQDYLITTRGDTIQGKINFQSTNKVENAIVKGDKRQTISAIATHEALVKGIRYKPVQYNGSVQFMQILKDGYLSLLAFRQPNLMSYDGRLLQKRDGKVLEVPGIGFKKFMSNYLTDYPELSIKIKEGELGIKELNEIIDQYNSYVSRETKTVTPIIVPESQQTKIEILSALQADIQTSNLATKQDALEILADWRDKLQNGKPIESYMIRALRNALADNDVLLKKLDELLE